MEQDNAQGLGLFDGARAIASHDRRSSVAPVMQRSEAGGPPSIVPRVVLVDDDARLRAVIRELLEDEGVAVVGEVGSGAAALEFIPAVAADMPVVALMDVRMAGAFNGIDAARLLIASGVSVHVLMFTAFGDNGVMQAARAAGAAGVLIKGAKPAEIIDAVRSGWASLLRRPGSDDHAVRWPV